MNKQTAESCAFYIILWARISSQTVIKLRDVKSNRKGFLEYNSNNRKRKKAK